MLNLPPLRLVTRGINLVLMLLRQPSIWSLLPLLLRTVGMKSRWSISEMRKADFCDNLTATRWFGQLLAYLCMEDYQLWWVFIHVLTLYPVLRTSSLPLKDFRSRLIRDSKQPSKLLYFSSFSVVYFLNWSSLIINSISIFSSVFTPSLLHIVDFAVANCCVLVANFPLSVWFSFTERS